MAKSRIPMGMGGNMNNMIKQAQKMQQNMLKMQEEIEQSEFEATAGGGAVCVKMSGKKELSEVKESMASCGADLSLMSGSGPTVFGIFENENNAKTAYKFFKEKFKETFLTKNYNV